MIKLLALAGIATMLAACTTMQAPAQRQAMGAAAEQTSAEGAATAASLGFHGPRRRGDTPGAD